MVFFKEGGLSKAIKSAKIAKLVPVQPLFGVYKGFVVVLRRGCGVIWRVKIDNL